MYTKKRAIGRIKSSFEIWRSSHSLLEKIQEWLKFLLTGRSLKFGLVYDNFHLLQIPDANSLLVLQEIFEHKVYDLFYPKTNPTIVDIGSHIGLSILFFKNKFPEAKIYGFEPNPRTFRYLSENIKRNNNTSDIQLHNKAVVEKSAKNKLYVKSLFSSRSSLFANVGTRKLQTVTVDTINFSELLKKFKKIDILKIDAEGMEHKFLPELLKHHSKIASMFIEVHRFDDLDVNYYEFLYHLSKKFEIYTTSSIPLNYVEAIRKHHRAYRRNDPFLIFAKNKKFFPTV